MENIIVKDTLKAFVTDLDTEKVYFLGATSSSNVTQSINQEFLRGDLGNMVVGVIQSNKEIKFSVTPTMYSDNVIAIQSGKFLTSSTGINLPKYEVKKVASGKVTIEGTPIDNVVVFDQFGKELTATETDGEVTITGATDGQNVTVYYEEASGSVEVLDLAVNEFPKNFKVDLVGIAYNPTRNTIVADLYWMFGNCIPDGALNQNYEAGNNANQAINFTAMADGTSYGKYVVAKRA